MWDITPFRLVPIGRSMQMFVFPRVAPKVLKSGGGGGDGGQNILLLNPKFFSRRERSTNLN